MTKQKLIDNMREMVKYILPNECKDDKDIVENYTDTMVTIAEEYHTEKLRISVVSGMSKLRRYLTGGMIGMCFEYLYRVESEIWYLPLSIGVLMSIAMIVDVITDYR